MSKRVLFAHIALIVAGFLFGANYWIAKGLMPEHLSPTPIIVFRTAGASIMFAFLLLFIKWKRIEPRDWFMIALCGLTGVTLNQYLFFAGLNYSSPVETAVLHTISPLVVVLLARFWIKEKIGISKATGIIFGFAGALIITLSGKEISFSSTHFTGNILILLNITAYSMYLVFAKPLMQKYPPVQVTALIFFFGFIFFLPFGIQSVFSVDYASFPPHIWQSLAYVIVCTTFLTYLLTVYALKPLQAGTVGFYIYMQPLISGAIGIITGRELLSQGKIFGAIMIFAGV
ncbi:MAG: EamA/RhaT family transporter, partial [Marinilabiliales bacterium]